jgi:DNA-binding Lrp family transcriptional regulator
VPKPKNRGLSVFKGREARLNRTIFQVLAVEGPLTIYDIHKHVKTIRGLKHTRYASVNKRVKILERLRYIERIGFKKTMAGFQAVIFELTTRAYLAVVLDRLDPEWLLENLHEVNAQTVLAAIIDCLE